MHISVILAHPHPGSFNHAITDTVLDILEKNGHHVFFHDLYAERFDPVLPAEEIPRDAKLDPVIASHCREIAEADGIIVIHPDWWGQPPAILKGWVDRVIRPGVAYRFREGDSGEGIPEGLLRAGKVRVFNTSNTPAAREQEIFSDPLENLWKICIFSFWGVPEFHRRMFSVVVTSTESERIKWLSEAGLIADTLFQLNPSGGRRARMISTQTDPRGDNRGWPCDKKDRVEHENFMKKVRCENPPSQPLLTVHPSFPSWKRKTAMTRAAMGSACQNPKK